MVVMMNLAGQHLDTRLSVPRHTSTITISMFRQNFQWFRIMLIWTVIIITTTIGYRRKGPKAARLSEVLRAVYQRTRC